MEWEVQPKEVKALYPKLKDFKQNPEYHETRETLWEEAETTP